MAETRDDAVSAILSDSSPNFEPRANEAVQEDDLVTFSIGESFKTFEEIEEKIKKYELSRSVQFWRCDSRTIDAAQRRIDRPLNARLKYYEVVYACIHGGKKFKYQDQGKRASS